MPRSLATRTFLMSVLLSIVVLLDVCSFFLTRREQGEGLTGWGLALLVLAAFNAVAFSALWEVSRDLRAWRQRLCRAEFHAALLRIGQLILLWASTVLAIVSAFQPGGITAFGRLVLPGIIGLAFAWHQFRLGRRADEV